ncbi:MAG TPA: hypothetical protein VFC42_04940 [Methylomirabilota bacterium]|jgi:hypothetical protein|nr:hypothetical protein [Methylomirabilota bacterium]
MNDAGHSAEFLDTHEPASTASLLAVVALLVGTALVFVAATAPLQMLIGPHRGAIAATFHGMAALFDLAVGTVGLYLAWRLWTGRIRAFADLQLLATAGATMSFLAIVFGNWLYIYYRDKEGPRSYFKANMPAIHGIFFEFKEFAALYTLPLTVIAAFILWYYGARVLDRKWLRYSVALLLALAFFYLVVAFGLGAAVTKLRPA